MLTVCYSPKGGQGCTTVAVALACLTPQALLIDAAGDATAVAGAPLPVGAGIRDLLGTDTPVTDELVDRLAITGGPVALVPAGTTPPHTIEPDRWARLADALTSARPVVIDAATDPAASAMPAARRIMVIQPCYLALRRAVAQAVRPDEIVLVADRHRALTAGDVEATLGAPVTVTVPIDPRVARAVDAGLFTARLPGVLARALAPLVEAIEVSRDG